MACIVLHNISNDRLPEEASPDDEVNRPEGINPRQTEEDNRPEGINPRQTEEDNRPKGINPRQTVKTTVLKASILDRQRRLHRTMKTTVLKESILDRQRRHPS